MTKHLLWRFCEVVTSDTFQKLYWKHSGDIKKYFTPTSKTFSPPPHISNVTYLLSKLSPSFSHLKEWQTLTMKLIKCGAKIRSHILQNVLYPKSIDYIYNSIKTSLIGNFLYKSVDIVFKYNHSLGRTPPLMSLFVNAWGEWHKPLKIIGSNLSFYQIFPLCL